MMMKKQTDMRYIVDAKDHFGEVKMWYDSKKNIKLVLWLKQKQMKFCFVNYF